MGGCKTRWERPGPRAGQVGWWCLQDIIEATGHAVQSPRGNLCGSYRFGWHGCDNKGVTGTEAWKRGAVESGRYPGWSWPCEGPWSWWPAGRTDSWIPAKSMLAASPERFLPPLTPFPHGLGTSSNPHKSWHFVLLRFSSVNGELS